MNRKINVGLLAYGLSGQVFHAPFMATNVHFNLFGVVERRHRGAADRYKGTRIYQNIESLIAEPEIDLVIVNTPNETHFEFASRALKAGKHVLIEKPVTHNIREYEELISLGKKTGKQLFVFQNRRYDSHFLSVRDAVEQGRLGKIVEAHFRYDRYQPKLGENGSKKHHLTPSSGLAYDLGPHLLDQAIALFGKPDRFIKVSSINRKGATSDDYFSFHLIYNKGPHVYLSGSLSVIDPQPGYILHGTQGSFSKLFSDVQEQQLLGGMLPNDPHYGLELGQSSGRLVSMNEQGETTIENLPNRKGDYNVLFDAVYESLVNGRPYPISHQEVSCQLEMLQAKGY